MPQDALPPFRVILADPPWQYTQRSTRLNGATDNHYPTMSTAEIAALPVGELAHDDAMLLLWATWALLPDAMRVIDAWGFRYLSGMPWVKADSIGTTFDGTLQFRPNLGVGFWVRGCTEPLLLARRGTPKRPLNPPIGILSDRSAHSRKPTCVYGMAESFGGPRLELFARQKREGWWSVGNEIGARQDIREALPWPSN